MESQVITKILEEKDITPLIKASITVDYFVEYTSEARFIYDHYNDTNTIPTRETFLTYYPEFNLTTDTETWEFLIIQLREGLMFTQLQVILRETVPMIEENALLGYNHLTNELATLIGVTPTGATDIVKDARVRLEEYKQRASLDDKGYITTGFPDLDSRILGWNKGEELATIIARTNQGKSWLLMKFLTEAWKQGKRVGMYSGEMGETQLGYRFDALKQHLSNMALMSGDVSVQVEYENYIEELSKQDTPFIILTPQHLGNRQATVQDIDYLIKKHDLDIIGIDQFSLMHDYRSKPNDQVRTKLANISADLFHLSGKYGIPVLSVSQVNRDSAKDKNIAGVDNISESDAIGHNSTKVIAMRQVGEGFELSVTKNRYGPVGDILTYFWDIDTGNISFLSYGRKEDSVEDFSSKSNEENNSDNIFPDSKSRRFKSKF